MNTKTSSSNKLSILICIDSFYDGGAEMFAIRLANNLINDANVYFFTLRPWLTKKNKQQKLLNKNVTFINITGSIFGDLLFNFLTFLSNFPGLKKLGKLATQTRLLSVCKKYKIQIVNSHSWETDNAFARVRDQGNFKLVSSFHGHYELFEGSWKGYEEECRKLLQKVDSIVYLSPKHIATLDKYEVPDYKRRKIFYGLPFPIEKSVTKYSAGEKLKLVMAARGISEKGWEEAVDATISVNKELGDVLQLELIGNGEALDKLKQKCIGHTYIYFLGHCDNILPNVQNAHVGLLPSYYTAESLPNTVIEYLMCGKPVIASTVGAIPEMITYNEEVAGTLLPLIENKVSSEMIKKAILDYIQNPKKVEYDSEIALKAAKKFEMEKCIQNYLNLFYSIL